MTDVPRVRPASAPGRQQKHNTFARFLALPPGSHAQVVFHSQELIGLDLHWIQHRSCVCVACTAQCPYCLEQKPYWHGFGLALVKPFFTPFIVCIPLGAYQGCQALQDFDGNLRGRIFDLERRGREPNSPMAVYSRSDTYKGGWPAMPDLRDCLAKRYGCELEWGCS